MLNFQTSQLIQFQCTIFVFMLPYIWRCLLPKMPLIDHKRSLTFSLNSSRPSDIYMHHWSRPSLIHTETIYIYIYIACSVPNHCLNQCWIIVNWTIRNTLKWNLNQTTTFQFKKSHWKISSAKYWLCLSRTKRVSVSVETREPPYGTQSSVCGNHTKRLCCET